MSSRGERPPEIPAPSPPPPLRLPDQALPPYRFVPGLHPHPFRDPDGHMVDHSGAPKWSAEDHWTEDEGYLRGCDLFDHRYLWEAHEAWEGVWHQVPQSDAYRDLLQSLIQGAASILKAHMSTDGGAARLHERSVVRLEQIIATTGPHFKGLDLPAFIERLNRFHVDGTWPTLPLEPT